MTWAEFMGEVMLLRLCEVAIDCMVRGGWLA